MKSGVLSETIMLSTTYIQCVKPEVGAEEEAEEALDVAVARNKVAVMLLPLRQITVMQILCNLHKAEAKVAVTVVEEEMVEDLAVVPIKDDYLGHQH
jgi:hypothetical protein